MISRPPAETATRPTFLYHQQRNYESRRMRLECACSTYRIKINSQKGAVGNPEGKRSRVTVVTIKMNVFWGVKRCSLVDILGTRRAVGGRRLSASVMPRPCRHAELYATPWKRMGNGRTASCILNLGAIWRRVVSFALRPLYPPGICGRYSSDTSLVAPQSRYGRCGKQKNLCPC
jgi:hypothetical protein